tara:strand:+ start:161 stop:358 length:198 start_codon:yes stop_codon:yes gene_type:complete
MNDNANKIKEMLQASMNLECYLDDLGATSLYKKDEFDEDAPTPSDNRMMLRELCKRMIATIDSVE